MVVDHVIFVVHGMGNQTTGHGRYAQNLAMLNKTCSEVLQEEFSDQQTNVLWIPIEWYTKLHDLETINDTLKSTTLPTCSMMRFVANDILSDVLYYFTSFHGQKLLNIVAKEVNEAYAKFIKENPDFHGTISFYTHSLGSIIIYDILANQPKAASPPQVDFPVEEIHFPLVYPKLDFMPDFLFGLGSPLAPTLVMRGQSFKDYQLPESIQYYNIFNLYDPLAYRIEPLLDKRFKDISPILIERPSTEKSSQKTHYYREMILSYLPEIKMPDFFILPNMDFLSFPSFPTLSVPESFQRQFSNLVSSIMGPSQGVKRKHEDDEPISKKRLELDEDGVIESVDVSSSVETSTQEQQPTISRIIKPAKSRLHSRARSPSPPRRKSFSLTNPFIDTFMPQLRTFLSLDIPNTKLQTEETADAPFSKETVTLGEELTRELMEAAKKAQDDIDKEEPKERFDYFVQNKVIENTVHQVIIVDLVFRRTEGAFLVLGQQGYSVLCSE